jgi:hypothetical protein
MMVIRDAMVADLLAHRYPWDDVMQQEGSCLCHAPGAPEEG